MLDHKHCVPRLHKLLQNLDQLMHICRVKTCGWLVQHIDRSAIGNAGQLRCQLDALRLTAGKGRAGLTQLYIAKTNFHQFLRFPVDLWNILKELHCFFRSHVQHLGDILSLVLYLQGFPVVAGAPAYLTGNIHVRQKVHFDLYQAVAAAGLTPAALHIEGEAAGTIAADPGIRSRCKKIADIIEQAGIGSGVGARCTADRALVNVDHLVQMLHADDLTTDAGAGTGMIQLAKQGLVQHLIYEAGFTRAGYAGDAGQRAQRNIHIHILQIVFCCSANGKRFSVALSSYGRNRDLLYARQVLTGNGFGFGNNILQCAGGHDLTAMAARSWAHIHNVIRRAHCILVMLYYNQGVPQIPKLFQSRNQLVVISLVQTNRRLIQNIQYAHQRGSDLGCKADSLALATGKRTRCAGQGQVFQSHVLQKLQS